MFNHTQGKFWGGAHLSFGIFAALAIFPLTGLFGAEQMYLRNPMGALIKILGNLLTFGFLYFYDIVQIISDGPNIRKAGIQYPFVGPTGIGAGIFTEDGVPSAPEGTPGSWKYIVYALLTLLPFGGDHFFVGDTMGGIMKAFCTIMFFLWPFAIIIGVIDIYRAFIGTEGLLAGGVKRGWPLSLFMGPEFSVSGVLGPIGDAPAADADGFIKGILMKILGLISNIPIIGPFLEKVGSTVVAVADTAVSTGVAAVSAASTVAATAATAAAAIPVIGAEVTTGLHNMTTVEGIKQIAVEQGIQTGGAMESPLSATAFIFIAIALFVTASTTFIIKRAEKNDMPPAVESKEVVVRHV
jgi:hypothetical protein